MGDYIGLVGIWGNGIAIGYLIAIYAQWYRDNRKNKK